MAKKKKLVFKKSNGMYPVLIHSPANTGTEYVEYLMDTVPTIGQTFIIKGNCFKVTEVYYDLEGDGDESISKFVPNEVVVHVENFFDFDDKDFDGNDVED